MSNTVESIEIDERRWANAAEIFKLLGHPLRLRILAMLKAAGELPAGAFHQALGETQPTLSLHLNRMRVQNLLKIRKSGGHILYSVAQPQLFKLLESIVDCDMLS